MKVVVYVEGTGDRVCLETLLRPLIATKEAAGIAIDFNPMTSGDHKTALLTKAPVKAALAIRNDPNIHVVVLPDLYPPNKGFSHFSCSQMQEGIQTRFIKAATRTAGWDERWRSRFRVFCMIHDLEVLLLAAEESLMDDRRLSSATWTKPVEEQDQGDPPKRVIERLFARTDERYRATVDGRRILERADWRVVSSRCPNGFGAFASFLDSLTPV